MLIDLGFDSLLRPSFGIFPVNSQCQPIKILINNSFRKGVVPLMVKESTNRQRSEGFWLIQHWAFKLEIIYTPYLVKSIT